MQVYYNFVLHNEFLRCCINVSAIYDGQAVSFAHTIKYDIADNRLIVNGRTSTYYKNSAIASLLFANSKVILRS